MAEMDNEKDYYGGVDGGEQMILATPDSFDFEVEQGMDDHDMLIHHVAQHDSQLYALDCCLGEMLGV